MASSLPPTPDQGPAPPLAKPKYLIEKNSVVRKKAVAIVAMRAQGFSTEEIATELRIKPASVSHYVWQATKSGFLLNRRGESLFTDPKDRIEFELAHKAVRNMNEFLDSTNTRVRKEFTLEIAKGALFKKFDQPTDTTALSSVQVLAIKIDMPTISELPVRDGSVGGEGLYIEGEITPGK